MEKKNMKNIYRKNNVKRKLSASITLRCTPEYKKCLSDSAKQANVSVGTYIRDCLALEADVEIMKTARRKSLREPKRFGITEEAKQVALVAADISWMQITLYNIEKALIRLGNDEAEHSPALSMIKDCVAANKAAVDVVFRRLTKDLTVLAARETRTIRTDE